VFERPPKEHAGRVGKEELQQSDEEFKREHDFNQMMALLQMILPLE
jgi:hypothetical protein